MAIVVFSRSITVPLMLAVAVAPVAAPTVTWLEQRGVARESLGSLIAIALCIGVFVAAGLLIGSALVDQSNELRLQIDEAQSQIESFLDGFPIDPGIVGLILAVPIASVSVESVPGLKRRGYFDDDSEA